MAYVKLGLVTMLHTECLGKTLKTYFQQGLWFAFLSGLVLSVSLPVIAGTQAGENVLRSAAALRVRSAELGPRLDNSPFKRPIVLDSAESANQVSGNIYALVDYPFATVNQAFNGVSHWCDMLILHINTKHCRASLSPMGSTLAVTIGRKDFQELEQAYRVQFDYRVATTAPDYFDAGLYATAGPMGTSDYRIRLEAVAMPGDKAFIHLFYAYSYGFAGRLAMQAYLTTVGREKIGFTSIGSSSDEQTVYIRGVRGVVERNTLRYYLAIAAYLGALTSPPSEQLEQRLQNWFTSTELYAAQLHEIDRATYLDMKRREYERQTNSP